MFSRDINGREKNLSIWLIVIFAPLILALGAFKAYQWDFSVPFVYHLNDDMWQLILTKWLLDNGWILNNPFLGAPDIAHGHYNSAAQTSSLHSIIMKFIGFFVTDSVKVQNYYYFLNFSLISATSYISFRLLGVSRLFAVPFGILFSLSLARLNIPYFAFISNYFMIPLAIVVVIWCAKGAYIDNNSKNLRDVFNGLTKSNFFWLSLPIIFLMAISDGYYAFFTIMLLGLSSALVFFHKPNMRIVNSLIPLFFAGMIMGVVLLVMSPLTIYKSAHHEEFFPGGNQDPSLTIHPFEAEVYASTLKTLLIPNLNHPVDVIANIGKTMTQSGADARKFGYGVSSQLGSFASLSFLLLLSIFLYPKWILDNKFVSNKSGTANSDEAGPVLFMLAVISGFIFLCETLGGIGSLIAFIYPYIRAYERFSFFLIFCVLLAVGFFLTHAMPKRYKNHPPTLITVILITVIFLFDQIPVNLARSMELPHVKRFLAERDLVKSIEGSLKPGDMIYQYPYAQYMAPSIYYGMGSQAHMRSYLHSNSLRWSNGASKNSKVDLWHRNLATRAPAELFHEMAIYNFKGVLVDRWVVKDDEFKSLKYAAQLVGATNTLESNTAKMAFFDLPDYGFHLSMNQKFNQPERFFFHKTVSIDYSKLPPYINGELLKKILNSKAGNISKEIYFKDYPELIDLKLYSTITSGLEDNLGHDELQGDIECVESQNTNISDPESKIILEVRNNSKVPWRLNSGTRPITLGYHMSDDNEKLVSWDNGFRIDDKFVLLPGEKKQVSIKAIDLKLKSFDKKSYTIAFELLQEGNAWFGVNPQNKVCVMNFDGSKF